MRQPVVLTLFLPQFSHSSNGRWFKRRSYLDKCYLSILLVEGRSLSRCKSYAIKDIIPGEI
jgi:hypothetical protein